MFWRHLDHPLKQLSRRRGFALADSLLAVGLTAICMHGLYIVHRIVDHYADIGGTAAAFAHFVNAQHSYFQANPDELTIPNLNQLIADGHLTGATLIDASTAHLDNTDHTFELLMIQSQPMLTTVVEYESRAQRIAYIMGPLASYEVEDPMANTFRVRLATLRTHSLETLIETKSMHVRGSTNRLTRLNFSPRAVKTVGTTCQPEPGVWMGGLATNASGKLLVCQRVYNDRDRRVWRVAGSYTSNPYPTNRCGDGTIVANVNTDCKNCWNGSNIHISGTCPVQPTCGDGTPVVNTATQCKNCWNGANIHVSSTCPTQPSCGDGTIVSDVSTECKDCWDGANIHVTDTCPPALLIQYCGDGTAVTDRLTWCEDCWDGTNIFLSVPSSCPPLVIPEYCGDGSRVTDAVTDCQDCWDGSNIPTTSTCPAQPTCDDGTPVINFAVECKDCPDGTNIHVSDSCPAPPQQYCDDGTPVDDKAVECKDCPDGINIPVANTCPAQPMCGDGTVVSDITTECKNCQCGQNIHVDATCPGPMDQCGNGAYVCNSATDCKDCPGGSNIPITSDCPMGTLCCDNSIAYPPNTCPVEQVCWDNSRVCPTTSTCPTQPTCGDGTLVTNPATECKTCCNGDNVAIGATCPSLTYSCADSSNSYPNCCCPNMTPIETQNMCSVVWSCPPKPTIGGLPPDFSDPRFVVVTTEHECYFEQTLVCVVDAGSCYGPGNYCANVQQVFYNPGGLCSGSTDIFGNACNTGFTCSESIIGP